MSVLATVVLAFWLMLPAYVPNNAAVLTGGGPSIDGGRTWRGDRLLGDGKTWRGSAGGVLAGFLLALLLNQLAPLEIAGATLPEFPVTAALGLAVGAILGDIAASFVKRRSGRERGKPMPPLDQLDFVIGAFAVTLPVSHSWFVEQFTLPVIAAVVVITPLLHVSTNFIAFKLDLKDEPY